MTLPATPQPIAEHLHTQLRLWRSEQDVALPGTVCAQLASFLTPLIVQHREEAATLALELYRHPTIEGRTVRLPPVEDNAPELDPTP